MLGRIKSSVAAAGRSILSPAVDLLFRADLSYAGAGEDRIVIAWLQNNFGLTDASQIRYCDIGANHPRELNNTYALYRRGARGLLIEPDPDMCALLRSRRPRDIVVNAGVAYDERRSARLTRFTSSLFNTFSADQASTVLEKSKRWEPGQLQEVVDEIDVPLLPANEFFASHMTDGFHFLSIDAEGVDFAILQSIDLQRFRPNMICVEAYRPPEEFNTLLVPAGYELTARTPDNLIYRRL